MISLLTGNPGMGKTSFMVWMLMTRKDLQGRPLYVIGVPDLKLPHLPVPEGHGIEDMHFWLPKGAILVIDEAQNYFRPRPAGSKVPNYVMWLEVHRHRGVDIFVLTQKPRLLDVNLRSLVGEHRHISKTMLAGLQRQTYWTTARDPDSRADISDGKHSLFFKKRKAFGMYKSSAEHTKIEQPTSLWVYVMPLLVIACALGIFYVLNRYESMKAPQQQDIRSVDVPSAQSVQDQYGGVVTASASDSSANLKAEDWIPALDGKPWTAPIYNGHNRNIQTMPFPVACVKNGSKCTCYTDQATPIMGLDHGLCIDFVEHGIYNPYRAPQQSVNDSAVLSGPGSMASGVADL